MNDFYKKIEDRLVVFCEKKLCPWAEKEFERCEDPKKRFHFPAFFYRLETTVVEQEGNNAVFMRASLGKKGTTELLYQWEQELVWSVEEDCMLPPKKQKKEKNRPKKTGQG